MVGMLKGMVHSDNIWEKIWRMIYLTEADMLKAAPIAEMLDVIEYIDGFIRKERIPYAATAPRRSRRKYSAADALLHEGWLRDQARYPVPGKSGQKYSRLKRHYGP